MLSTKLYKGGRSDRDKLDHRRKVDNTSELRRSIVRLLRRSSSSVCTLQHESTTRVHWRQLMLVTFNTHLYCVVFCLFTICHFIRYQNFSPTIRADVRLLYVACNSRHDVWFQEHFTNRTSWKVYYRHQVAYHEVSLRFLTNTQKLSFKLLLISCFSHFISPPCWRWRYKTLLL